MSWKLAEKNDACFDDRHGYEPGDRGACLEEDPEEEPEEHAAEQLEPDPEQLPSCTVGA